MDGDGNKRHLGPNGNKFNVDDLLSSLLRATATSPSDGAEQDQDPENQDLGIDMNLGQLDLDLGDVSMQSIAGEYSALNNTIDELNSFLDRWDARHDRLRSEIREALQEAAESNETEIPSDGVVQEVSTSDEQSTESSTVTSEAQSKHDEPSAE